jgi:ribosomal protein S18 acetylase RimI-like enzyme
MAELMTPTAAIVRPAQPADEAQLRKLWALKDAQFWPFAYTWKSFWEKPPAGAKWIVVECDGELVGSCHYRERPKDGYRYIHEIVVAPSARRRGIGKLMLDQIGDPIELKTNDTNKVSNAFYRAHNFYLAGKQTARNGQLMNIYRRDVAL